MVKINAILKLLKCKIRISRFYKGGKSLYGVDQIIAHIH